MHVELEGMPTKRNICINCSTVVKLKVKITESLLNKMIFTHRNLDYFYDSDFLVTALKY